MPALQSIDTAVFRFVNETMANPFFDTLMPILAGGWWLTTLLVVTGLLVIWKGGRRGQLLALMLAIVVPAGDWITDRIKHAVARPRPCHVVATVRLPMRLEHPRADDDNEFHHGCPSTGSMPSGHTANWFAATMVALIFDRRTLRVLLPLAALVAFSRVYNGVHYLSDVIVGAVVGAGYGVALALAVDGLWRFAARRWFPRWWSVLPTLLPAAPAIDGCANRQDHRLP